jgi:hypothetical protein
VLREFEAFAGEAIEVWRRGVAAVEGDVGPAEVVGDDKDNVG